MNQFHADCLSLSSVMVSIIQSDKMNFLQWRKYLSILCILCTTKCVPQTHFDKTTNIYCVLTGIIKARECLLTLVYIVDFPMYFLEETYYAFDQTQKSNTTEVNIILLPSHHSKGNSKTHYYI